MVDVKTKLGILHKRAAAEHIRLPEDVALFIVKRTKWADLEEALVLVIAWCSMHGVEISTTAAQASLKPFLEAQRRNITIDSIQRMVAEQFHLRVAELQMKNNTPKIVGPRQIAMYLAKQLTDASFPEIGRKFGGKHHTTVIHAVSKIEKARKTDKDLSRTLSELQAKVKK